MSNKAGHIAATYAVAQSAGFDNANAVPAIKMQKSGMSTKNVGNDAQIRATS
jgi:hypothetical protein